MIKINSLKGYILRNGNSIILTRRVKHPPSPILITSFASASPCHGITLAYNWKLSACWPRLSCGLGFLKGLTKGLERRPMDMHAGKRVPYGWFKSN